MQHNNRTGRLSGAKWVPSMNYDERPLGVRIDAVVIHCISLPPGQYGGDDIERFFCNRLDHGTHPYFERIRGVRVSAHFLIKRKGELVQFVSTLKRAWHAGRSVLDGTADANNFSIGVELEGVDDDVYTDFQYRSLASLTRALMAAFPGIDKQRIAGHCDIAPDRKTDPGPMFDWKRFHRDALV
ncbi:MAG: 1,6-anhydro-N-acetylmuramyl-L-alanine amidase AmpD [Gammaproteobacteria bacterium]|nr:1,6-anhydro-N-acetylmuramyl-L-alanine amidase AmpD [Gammaproteobacteria bacterium]